MGNNLKMVGRRIRNAYQIHIIRKYLLVVFVSITQSVLLAPPHQASKDTAEYIPTDYPQTSTHQGTASMHAESLLFLNMLAATLGYS